MFTKMHKYVTIISRSDALEICLWREPCVLFEIDGEIVVVFISDRRRYFRKRLVVLERKIFRDGDAIAV